MSKVYNTVIDVNMSLSSFEEYNNSFDKAVLKIADANEVAGNGIRIPKEVFESAITSIFNCPVVCRYDSDADDFGGHDIGIRKNKDDKLELYHLTQPIGVVPESSKQWWGEEDGVISLFTEVLLWKRQDGYEKLKENMFTKQSMEIKVIEFHTDEDGVIVVDKLEFLAFCLLGEDQTPAFPTAGLSVFSTDQFKKELEAMFVSLNQVSIPKEGIDNKDNTKGGGLGLDKAEFAILATELRNQLESILYSKKFKEDDDERVAFWYIDHSDDEVYCHDVESGKICAFTYQIEKDVVSINFENKTFKKLAYVDLEEGEAEVKSYEHLFVDKSEEIKAEFEAAKIEFSEKLAELEELQNFKAQRLSEDRANAETEVFESFADLKEVEEFVALQENCADLSIEDIKEKCFAIRGKNVVAKFTTEAPKAPRLPVEKRVENKTDVYGGLFNEFPPSR